MIQEYFAAADAVIYALFALLIVLSVMSWSAGVLRILSTRRISRELSSLLPSVKSLSLCAGDWQRSAKLEELQTQLQSKLGSGLGLIAVTASTAPFIGLLGTVWSIVKALGSVGGGAGLSAISAQIGEALIMTALGLLVAIPAVMLYNSCVQINRKVFAEFRARLLALASQSPAFDSSAQATDPASGSAP